MITEQTKKLGEGLVAAKIITQEQLNRAMVEAAMDNAPSLIVNLLSKNLLTYQIFEKFITKSMGIKSAIISERKFDPQLVAKIGEVVIRSRYVFPLALKEGTLILAMVDPLDGDAIGVVEKITKLKVSPLLISLPDFEQTIRNFFAPSGIHVSSKAEAEKLVLIRPGGYEEEIAFADKTKTVQKQQAPRISSQVEMDDFSGGPTSPTSSSLLGTSAKKYREEILAKLNLQGSDAKALKKELYTKELFYNDTAEISPKILEQAYEKLGPAGKIEAIANALIKLGIMNKHDLMKAAAVAAVFGKSENP